MIQDIKTNSYSITQQQVEFIFNLLVEKKPKNICELGSGVSTQLFEMYKNNHDKDCNIISIEHDDKFAYPSSYFHNLIIDGEYTIGNKQFKDVNYYENLLTSISNNKFDFVFIDGPFGYNPIREYSRIQMLEFVDKDLLSDEGVFIIHDTERESSQNTQKILYDLFKAKNYSIEIDEQKSFHKQLTTIYFSKK